MIELITGDSLRHLRTMASDSVDAVVTDPPWNLGKRYGAHDDAMPPERYLAWLADVLSECTRIARGPVVLLPGACNAHLRPALLRRARLHPVAELTWRKPAPEPIVWAGAPPPPTLPAIIWAREPAPHDPALGRHPCPKPIALFEHLVQAAVAPAGTVLDPFAGTGTTLLAAAVQGRAAIGIEIEPRFCRVARGRHAALVAGAAS